MTKRRTSRRTSRKKQGKKKSSSMSLDSKLFLLIRSIFSIIAFKKFGPDVSIKYLIPIVIADIISDVYFRSRVFPEQFFYTIRGQVIVGSIILMFLEFNPTTADEWKKLSNTAVDYIRKSFF